MQSANLTKKDLQLLGRLLVKHRPEVARELFHSCVAPQPIETDLARIPSLFLCFCAIRGLSPSEYTGPLLQPKKNIIRRVFIGAILRMYAPEVYNMPKDCIVLKRGLQKQLGMTLPGEKNLSRAIRKVVAEEGIYEDFRAQVAMTVEQLTQKEEVTHG